MAGQTRELASLRCPTTGKQTRTLSSVAVVPLCSPRRPSPKRRGHSSSRRFVFAFTHSDLSATRGLLRFRSLRPQKYSSRQERVQTRRRGVSAFARRRQVRGEGNSGIFLKLQVYDRYKDDGWLGSTGDSNEWRVAYHGTNIRNLPSILLDGLKLVGSCKERKLSEQMQSFHLRQELPLAEPGHGKALRERM